MAARPRNLLAAATDEESKEYQVGVILKTTSSEYWSYVMAGVDAAEEELGNVYAQVYGASSRHRL